MAGGRRQVVVLDVEASEYFAVNQTGATLWTLLVDGATTDDLVQRSWRNMAST